ncbi:MAG: hypothetical protein AB7I27_05575 [Bacteriovoracaceae bacterium]
MKRWILTLLSLFLSFNGFSQSYMKNEIEDEKQTDFPGIVINGHTVTDLYSINLDGDAVSNYDFKKTASLESGTFLKINSYILAKEIFDSINIKSASSKIDRSKLEAILDSKDDQQLNQFFLDMTEKLRLAQNSTELKLLTEIINKKKTEEDPLTTLHFKTGFIEVMPLDDSDIRYFVPIGNLKSVSIDARTGKLKLLQAMTLLSFKKLKSSLNFGDVSADEERELNDLERALTSACNQECAMNKQESLSNLIFSMINLTNYDFFQNFSGTQEMNKKVSLAQLCLLQKYNETCPNEALTQKLIKLRGGQTEGNFKNLCRDTFQYP